MTQPSDTDSAEPHNPPVLTLLPAAQNAAQPRTLWVPEAMCAAMGVLRLHRRAKVQAQGRRWRESLDDSCPTRVLLNLGNRLVGDAPVVLDYWQLADRMEEEPAALRSAVAELAEARVVAVEAGENGSDLVWLNPFIFYSEATNIYLAARRHRSPRIQTVDGRPAAVPFEQIVWLVPRPCPTVMLSGVGCGWDLNTGLCPDHATDEDHEWEAAALAEAEELAERERRETATTERARRRRIRTHPCTACGAQADAHCRTRTGGRASSPHTARLSHADEDRDLPPADDPASRQESAPARPVLAVVPGTGENILRSP
ncbi:hypothetical protein ACFVZ3_06595 [Kitasatospora purpeofusca]|uniref:zinc finger domain-containing protein n=1 Tax=Kitasatospora purpeofusca TaxID=67352 RepID=UPI0036A012D8